MTFPKKPSHWPPFGCRLPVVLAANPRDELSNPYGYYVLPPPRFDPWGEGVTRTLRCVGWALWATHLHDALAFMLDLSERRAQNEPLSMPPGYSGPVASMDDLVAAAVAKFALSVWELCSHGWTSPDREAAAVFASSGSGGRVVSVGPYSAPSYVEGVFGATGRVYRVLLDHSEIEPSLSRLRERHRRAITSEPWAWLPFHWEADRLHRVGAALEDDLLHLEIPNGGPDSERWRRRTAEDLNDLLEAGPGFDWALAAAGELRLDAAAASVVGSMRGTDMGRVEVELIGELRTVLSEETPECFPCPSGAPLPAAAPRDSDAARRGAGAGPSWRPSAPGPPQALFQDRPEPPPPADRRPEWVMEHFRSKQYQLMDLLWGKEHIPVAEIYKALYGGNAQKEALDQLKNRVNRKLAEIADQVGQSLEITTRNKCFLLRPLAG